MLAGTCAKFGHASCMRVPSMNMDAQRFWNDVRCRWTPRNDAELRDAAHQVLRHLRHRLAPGEAQRLFSALPSEVARLASEPGSSNAGQQGMHEDELDIPAFYERVARDGGVPRATAMQATEAVFLALARHLPNEERDRVHRSLPRHLRHLWLVAEAPGTPSPPG